MCGKRSVWPFPDSPASQIGGRGTLRGAWRGYGTYGSGRGNWRGLQRGYEPVELIFESTVQSPGSYEIATTITNQYGEYTFSDVPPGKNYVITALYPDYEDDRPLVKDVALELVEGGSFDTGITDLVSTSLGLVVDFLVEYTEWGPEDISLDEVLADSPDFPNFPKFLKLVYEVRRVLENCEVNLLTDEGVQDALCLAAEEISGLDIGCDPGFTFYNDNDDGDGDDDGNDDGDGDNDDGDDDGDGDNDDGNDDGDGDNDDGDDDDGNTNNGHGNNIDGVDSSNPGQGGGGPGSDGDPSTGEEPEDDEK